MLGTIMKLCVVMLLVSITSGCTTRAAYEAVRTNERQHCDELSATERERCLARLQDDFDEYQRKRAEVEQQ